MSTYRGIIFDLDGTLLDTLEDIADCCNRALAQAGLPPLPVESYKLRVGLGFENLIRGILPEGGEALFPAALAAFHAAYREHYMDKTRAYPGTLPLLEKLAARGVLLAVNSNKRDDYVHRLIEKHFGGIPWTFVAGERAGVPKKPDPATAREIIAKMELPREAVVYIGDSKTDIMTGRNAGLATIGVLWGFRDRAELEAAGAAMIASTCAELESLLI